MYWVLYLFITRVWVTAFWNHGFVHFSQNGNAAIKKYFPARIIQSSVETATTKPVTTEVSNSSSSVIPEVVASAVAAAVATQNIMKASQLSLWQKNYRLLVVMNQLPLSFSFILDSCEWFYAVALESCFLGSLLQPISFCWPHCSKV